MIKHIFKTLIFSLLAISTGLAQEDPVLFTVNGNPVQVSEFDYIYNKNNGESADYSNESLSEYLNLYTKFKLKVEKAKGMGLDTLKRLNDELAGYRKQLASNYLVDKEVSEKLINEVIERMKTDVEVSHIFIANPPNSSPQKGKDAFEKVNLIYGELQRGKRFEDLAKTMSDDKRSGLKGGGLGHYVAMLPGGFYEFENAMYNTPVGEVARPIKSKMGYHIIRVEGTRPARGEMEVSHILIKKSNKRHKHLIDSLQTELKDGQDFGKLASLFSEDSNTNTKAGYLGFFKINQFEKAFEDAAFALVNDGEVSGIVETTIGYHLIKRHTVKAVEDEAKVKRKVQATISKDERFAIAKKGLIEKIKKDGNLEENKIALEAFTAQLNEDFYSYKWKVPNDLKEESLIKIGDFSKGILDFAKYCKKDTRSRLRYNKSAPLEESVNELYEKYVDEKMLEYEEANLSKKYPEFKALMREYEEGILLFEATKMEVWDKASSDSIGLENFYAQNQERYKWEERYEVENMMVNTDDPKKLKSILKKAKKKSAEELLSIFNIGGEELITVETKTVEKEDAFSTKKGAVSKPSMEEGKASFSKIKSILPSSFKTLKEARGYIIADYQDVLEANWVKALKEEYPIVINQAVFDGLIK